MQYVLPRTGQPPLTFEGTLLADVCGHYVNGREQVRYHDLALYSAEVLLHSRPCPGYIVSIAYVSRFKAEKGRSTVIECHNRREVEDVLGDYDCVSPVAGYPPLPAYAARQARLLADIERAYSEQVSELLTKAGFTEHLTAKEVQHEVQ